MLAQAQAIKETVDRIFKAGGDEIYTGYVDDPRNTDNAWMETVRHFRSWLSKAR
jgi:hypothetical protein